MLCVSRCCDEIEVVNRLSGWMRRVVPEAIGLVRERVKSMKGISISAECLAHPEMIASRSASVKPSTCAMKSTTTSMNSTKYIPPLLSRGAAEPWSGLVRLDRLAFLHPLQFQLKAFRIGGL